MYKFFRIFISFFILFFLVSSTIIYADDINEPLNDDSFINDTIVETTSKPEEFPNINSRAAIVIDRNSNTILYGKNEKEKRKMASTTKIMTCIIVLENGNLNDIVEVSKKSAGTGGSRLGLKTGDKITVKDLLYGLMLCSGNDAAVALAEHVGGSIEDFSKLMNDKAAKLNLENTHFVTPHGLDNDEHYTTAYELALLSNYALKNKDFAQIVGTKNYTVTINNYTKTLSNTNELLGTLNGIYGIKTGFTNGANRCLVTACKRGNMDIICVVLGADTKNFRTKDSIKLIEYVFKEYEPVNLNTLIKEKFDTWQKENLNDFYIEKGRTQNICLKYEMLEHEIIPLKKDKINNLDIKIKCKSYLVAPVAENYFLGTIDIYSENNLITSTKILTSYKINRKGIFDYFNYFSKNYISILTNV